MEHVIKSTETLQTKFICEYCKKPYKTKYTMNRHIQKCPVRLRDENAKENNQDIERITEIYEKRLMDMISKHGEEIVNISNRLKIEMNEIKTENTILRTLNKQHMNTIDNLQDRIETLAKEAINKPTIKTSTTNSSINNTTILNLTPIDFEKEDFKGKIDKFYDLDYMVKGIKGVAEFTKEKILKDETGQNRYVCSDPARMIFKYKDVDGEIRKDIKANKLLSKIRPGFINKATNIVMSMEDELEYNDLVRYQDMALVISTMYDNDKIIGEIAKLS